MRILRASISYCIYVLQMKAAAHSQLQIEGRNAPARLLAPKIKRELAFGAKRHWFHLC